LKRCAISLGINGPPAPNYPVAFSQNFPFGIERLKEDLASVGSCGDFLFWNEHYPEGSPKEWEIHGAFKPFCFSEAAKAGYRLVLWLDASIRVKRPLDPLFDIIEKDGYLMFGEEHSIGEYCTDAAIEAFQVTREASFRLPCCWSCVFGLDLENERSIEFLKQWKERAIDAKTFAGPKWSGFFGWPRTASLDSRVHGHREQSVVSLIARKLGMEKFNERSLFRQYFDIDRDSVRLLKENYRDQGSRG